MNENYTPQTIYSIYIVHHTLNCARVTYIYNSWKTTNCSRKRKRVSNYQTIFILLNPGRRETGRPAGRVLGGLEAGYPRTHPLESEYTPTLHNYGHTRKLILNGSWTSFGTRRALAILEEAEGHQHLAGGHGVGANKCLPFRRGSSGVATPGFFLYILNTKSCILMHSLAPKMGTTSVFIKIPMHWGGGSEDCWKRLPNEARRAENRGRRPRAGWSSWGGAASPTSYGVWQWCKQDQILNTKTKTKIARPRPRR